MTESMWRGWSLFLLAGGLFLGAALAGCGGDAPPPACQDKSCQFGTCSNDADGACVNKEACAVDRDCVPGYVCGTDNSCRAETDCESDQDCEQGICGDDGACINPETCEADGDCVARTYCGADDICRPDPCNQVTCDRGVCERGTGECVSAASCTVETQQLDCVAGQKCLDSTCESEEAYCEQMTCERGVCSFEQESCVNAMECSEAGDCLDGYLCSSESGQCERDLCQYNNVQCPADAECIPSSGECERSTSCETSDDCRNDPTHLCIEGTCRLESAACGDAAGDGGCAGNRECTYDGESQTSTCVEPETCETSSDCDEGRQCTGQTCIDAVACADDPYEANDDVGAAVHFADFATDNTVEGSLCQGGRDVFHLETTDFASGDDEGNLQVTLVVPDRDLGHGEVTARLLDAGETELASETLPTMADSGEMTLSHVIGAEDHGEYYVELAGADGMSSAGVGYTLSVDMLEQATLDACRQAQTVKVGQELSATTQGAASTGMGSRCTSAGNPAPEKLFRLDLDRPREVTVTVEPQLSSTDLSVAMRTRCTDGATETACREDADAGEAESLTRVLEAGSHTIIVQAPDGSEGGPFSLTVDGGYYTRCAPGDNYCGDAQTAYQCVGDGGRYESVACDTSCNLSTGRCHLPEADRCLDAPTVDTDDSYVFQLGPFSNTYEIPTGGCLGDGDTKSDGPDRSYEVEVPANTEVTVEAFYPNRVQGSIYVASYCGDVPGTCVAGARGSKVPGNEERLTYTNETDQAQTRILVVDVGADQDGNDGEVVINVKYGS